MGGPATHLRASGSVASSRRPVAWNTFVFDHHVATRLDGQHQDRPLPHTVRYSVGDNRSTWSLTKAGLALCGGPRGNGEPLGLLDIAGLSSRTSTVASQEPFEDRSGEIFSFPGPRPVTLPPAVFTAPLPATPVPSARSNVPFRYELELSTTCAISTKSTVGFTP